MRTLGTLALLFFCGTLGVMAFVDPPADRLPPATPEQIAIANARAALAIALLDPDTAKVGPIFVGRAGYVCGMVNGKNAFGGFTGMRPFTFNVRTRALTFEVAAWNAHCAGVSYSMAGR
jgi:hypothetical protein